MEQLPRLLPDEYCMMWAFLYRLLGSTILLYAGLKSFKAIKSQNKEDDTQWLTFWLLYSVFEFTTTVSDILIGWILPFYNEIKLGFLIFIGLGGGAKVVFPMLEPYLHQAEKFSEVYQVEETINSGMAKATSYFPSSSGGNGN